MAKLILDYSTEAQFRSALASIPPNLVEAGTSVELLQTKAEILWSAPVTITGINTGPDNGIRLGCSLNASYTDNANIQTLPFAYSSTAGAAWKSTQPYNKQMLQIDVPHVTIDGMQFFQASGETEKVIHVTNNGHYFKMYRSIVDNAGWRNYCYPFQIDAQNIEIYSSLIVHRSSVEEPIYLNTNTALFENVNIVRPSDFTKGGYAFEIVRDTVQLRNCIFSGFNATVARGSITGGNNVSTGVIGFGSNNLENQLATDIFVNPLNDFRSKKSTLLEDKGIAPSSANTRAVNGVRQQGMATDIGAWEQPSTLVAPSATINNVVISGTNNNNVVISGVTTGAPTKGTISIFPADVQYNGAVGQGPIDITLTTNGFSSAFQNLRVGSYGISLKVSNDAYSETGINAYGTFEIVGAGTLTVVQEPMSGQMLTVHGTTFGNPTSGSLYVPPAAINPAGAVGQTIPLALTTGAFTVSKALPAGNYDAGLLTFTNAQGTSFPQPGTSAVTVLGFTGNPEAPADGETTAPNPVVESVAISPTTATGSTKFTATATGTDNPPQTFIFVAEKGTIDNEGNFVEPAKTSSVQVFTVTVKSTIAPTKMATATVTIPAAEVVIPPPPIVTGVIVIPPAVITPGKPIQLSFIVNGINSPAQSVKWTPANLVDSTGLVTLPGPTSVEQTFIIRATSTEDPTKYIDCTIVVPAMVVTEPDNKAKFASIDMVSPEGVKQVNLTGLSCSFFDQTDLGDLLAPVARTKVGTTDGQGKLTMSINGTTLLPGQSGRIIVGKGTKAFTGIVVVS